MRSAGVIAATVGRAVYLTGRFDVGTDEDVPLPDIMADEHPVTRIAIATVRRDRRRVGALVFICVVGTVWVRLRIFAA